MSGLINANDGRHGPGPWFTAHSPGLCSRCGDIIEPSDTIRADGFGTWECCEDDEPPATRFAGTTLDEMGF